MSLSKTWSITRKETLHIVRDRRTLFLVIFMPAFLLLLLAYVFSFDVENFRIALLDQDQSPLSRKYVSYLTSDGMLNLIESVRSYDEADQSLLASRVYAVLVIPPGFHRDLMRGEDVQVEVLLDGADPNSSLQTLGQLDARTWAFAQELAAGASRLAVVMAMPSLSISLAIAREKEHGTLEALLSTPLRKSELLVGKLLPYLASGLISLILAALVAILWFRVPFRGDFGLFLLLGLLFLFGSLALSLLISNFIGSQGGAMIANFLIFFIPGFFLTGLFDPIDTQNWGAMLRSYALPATHFVTISRTIFLKGAGLEALTQPVLILLSMGVGCLALSIASFRKRIG